MTSDVGRYLCEHFPGLSGEALPHSEISEHVNELLLVDDPITCNTESTNNGQVLYVFSFSINIK